MKVRQLHSRLSLAANLCTGGSHVETVCARAYREGILGDNWFWGSYVMFVDWIMSDEDHCMNSFIRWNLHKP